MAGISGTRIGMSKHRMSEYWSSRGYPELGNILYILKVVFILLL